MQFHLKNSGNCLGGQVGCFLQWDLHSRGGKLCWVSTWEKPSAASQETTEFHADTNLLGGPFGSILDSPIEMELTLCQQNTTSGSWLISTLVSYLQSEAKKNHLGSNSSLESTPLQWETRLRTGVSTLQTQRVSTSSLRMQNNSWNYLWGVPGVQLGCQLPPRWGKSICAASLEETQTTTWHGNVFPPEAKRFWFLAGGSPRWLNAAGASSWRRHDAWGLYREGLPAATSDWCRFQQRVTTHSRYLRGFPGGSWRRHLPPWGDKPAWASTW